ncbi:hypothetical protein F4777DRAFT_491571 [Nemania sp. FL0916]|nr:hypothetical protein F4777DRAFT_491571 [Nemania sp. FL0916]
MRLLYKREMPAWRRQCYSIHRTTRYSRNRRNHPLNRRSEYLVSQSGVHRYRNMAISEDTFRRLKAEDLEKPTYVEAQEKYTIKTAIAVNKDITAIFNESLPDFMRRAKAEMKRLLDELQQARAAMIETNQSALRVLQQYVPTSLERQDEVAIRAWAMKSDPSAPQPANPAANPPGNPPANPPRGPTPIGRR